jgi:hypothetical protein
MTLIQGVQFSHRLDVHLLENTDVFPKSFTPYEFMFSGNVLSSILYRNNFVPFAKYNENNQVEEDDMGGLCSINGEKRNA